MERDVEGNTDENICREGGGILILVESPGIGSSQASVLEDAQALDFSNIKNLWELRVSAERFLEIPNVAFFAALLVCLSEALALLKISSGFETGVVGGP